MDRINAASFVTCLESGAWANMAEEEIGKDLRELSNLLVEVLEEHIAHHRRVHALYEKAFGQVEGIALKSNPGKAWNANY